MTFSPPRPHECKPYTSTIHLPHERNLLDGMNHRWGEVLRDIADLWITDAQRMTDSYPAEASQLFEDAHKLRNIAEGHVCLDCGKWAAKGEAIKVDETDNCEVWLDKEGYYVLCLLCSYMSGHTKLAVTALGRAGIHKGAHN